MERFEVPVRVTRGRFISLEGGEGAGKSTQCRALAKALEQVGLTVVQTREPGGSEGAEAIRGLLLSGASDKWRPRTEALLFAAARSDHVERLIEPALARGDWVICDRFLDSSRAYQGDGDNLSDGDIIALHAIGSKGILPDRTLLLHVPPSIGAERVRQRDGETSDRIGGRSAGYHDAVRARFLQIAADEPDRIRVVDCRGSPEDVTVQLLAEISDLLL